MFLGLFPQPQPRRIIPADPAEIGIAKPINGAVIDHPTMRIAHRGIAHLPHAQLFHVARHTKLHQGFGIRPRHLVLSQRTQIHHGRFFTHRPIFLDGAKVGKRVG